MALCRCLPVCHSLSSAETDEPIELGFGVGASFHVSYPVLEGNLRISKN